MKITKEQLIAAGFSSSQLELPELIEVGAHIRDAQRLEHELQALVKNYEKIAVAGVNNWEVENDGNN